MIPTDEEIAEGGWTVSRMPRFEGLARTLFRRGPVTLLVAEKDDGSYELTKMRGGRVLDTRRLNNLPDHIELHVDKRRPRRVRHTRFAHDEDAGSLAARQRAATDSSAA